MAFLRNKPIRKPDESLCSATGSGHAAEAAWPGLAIAGRYHPVRPWTGTALRPIYRLLFLGFRALLLGLLLALCLRLRLLLTLRFTGFLLFFAQFALLLGILGSRFFAGLLGLVGLIGFV
ncbi:hypothetical protein [Oceanimonas marisflavi]|uniref:hypothetical protein n=1 Tax=Oceanimonas marisflavi TaxID=2059724 RepID=UPI000D309DB0|nr:hypothetical protein [Oceanimonas marisflavi]